MPLDTAPQQVSRARQALSGLLARLRAAAPQSARETLEQMLVEGLRSLPVPLLNVFLANLAENALRPGSQGPGLDDVLTELERMEASDGAFLEGMRHLGADVDQMLEDLAAIRSTQVGTEFRLARVTVDRAWPVADHSIGALLVNRGGGLVELDEIFLDVEEASPLVAADLSVPAAPLNVIELKATLDLDVHSLALFALNGEPSHQFSSGVEAERVRIDVDSRCNASYRVRLRLAYYDDHLESQRELVWPPADEPALELDYPWAPAWRPDTELLEPEAVLGDVADRLDGVARWLEGAGGDAPLPDGVPAYVAQSPQLLASLVAGLRAGTAGMPAAGRLEPSLSRLEAMVAGPPWRARSAPESAG